jgi:hypothetical protein
MSDARLAQVIRQRRMAYQASSLPNHLTLLDDAIKKLSQREQELLRLEREALTKGNRVAAAESRRLADHAASGRDAYSRLRKIAGPVWEGMQDPQSIVKVVNDIRREAQAIRASADPVPLDPGVTNVETQAVIRLSERARGEVRTITGRDTPQFFERHASLKHGFLDWTAALDPRHGASTHMVQDLVIDEALRRAGSRLRAGDIRTLLGNGDVHAAEVLGSARQARVGISLWENVLHDAPLAHDLHSPEGFYGLLKLVFPGLQ